MKKSLILFVLLVSGLMISGCTKTSYQKSSNFTESKKPTIQMGSVTIDCSSPKDDLQKEICDGIEAQEAGEAAWDDVLDSRP